MRLLRFILPFLFVRNWYDGSWEFSKSRFLMFVSGVVILGIVIVLAFLLQSPVMYSAL